ncbi:NAD-dependent epimerase/dehydratase family protein [Robertkochia aurantiaca]|uniref:NAD-dependent epimerase/dehydratase family protein n=1 Tax=Robertkochia aurantiaca TaxID=2873700 RepID=UPI001CCC0EED|nr:NAD-dependent epimerase/dehydratase family protein [Robertkochia sp. 3YJGBD-33]
MKKFHFFPLELGMRTNIRIFAPMILVTGGTGLIGSHLLLELTEKSIPVRAIYRNSEHISYTERLFEKEGKTASLQQVEWFRADLNDIITLQEALQGVTHCYHCAALVSFDPGDYHTLRKINIEGTANIVNCCLDAGVKKLCFVSSIATLGKLANRDFIDESSHWNSEEENNVYAITKYGAEMEVWRGTQEGLPAVIINPGVVLGESFRKHSSTDRILNVIHKRIRYYPKGGTGFVDVKDVVWAMVNCTESEIKNERFIAVGENRTYEEFLSLAAEIYEKPAPEKPLPDWLLSIMWRLDWLRSKLTGTKRKISSNTAKALSTTSAYDSLKLKKATGIVFNPLSFTLRRIAGHS